MPERMSREDAKNKVDELRGFYMHVAAYLTVNLFIFIVNWITSPEYWWFVYPLLGWAIGLALHAVGVFYEGGIWGKQWEERKIRELMAEDEERGGR